MLLAIHVPVTCRDPVTGTVLQPKLANETSMSPDKARQDDVTFQVPTTLPPQAVPLGQDAPPPVPLELPPVPTPPPVAVSPEPVFPPVAPPWMAELLQPLLAIAEARATALRSPTSLVRIDPHE